MGHAPWSRIPLFNQRILHFLAACIVLSLLKIPKMKELTEREWKIRRYVMIRNTLLIAIPSIIAVYYML